MRIISSLAGQASCVVTQNVYSANGKVVLIERGSEAVGEYRSGVSVGQRRLFVLWDRIMTPGGIVINLDSPGADELGSTGMTGKVDNHWWERIGSAFLLSTIQDALQYEIAEEQAKNGSGTLVFSNTAQTSDSMAQKVLDASINIPPTLFKNQGDRAVIYVARDLDFSNVYRLSPHQ
jgi:type IV secretion system protein VirB10